MTKALQVRSHPSAQGFTDRLIELFDDSDIGWDAARAIGQIVSTDKVLTKKNHAVIKVNLLSCYHYQLMLTLLCSSYTPKSSPT